MPQSNLQQKRPAKKRPWNPKKSAKPTEFSEQFGFPNAQRLAHAKRQKTDFEPEQLAVGHRQHGVIRSRQTSMLTHPALLAERVAVKTKAYTDQGQELPKTGVRVQETPSDRATAMWRHLLWQYFMARYEAIGGRAGSNNFEKSSHSSDLHRLPLTDSQFKRLQFYHWLRKQPGWKSLCGFLDKVAAQCNPEAHDPDYPIMSKPELGMWRIDTDNSRDAKCAVDGALAMICEALAEAAAEFVAQDRLSKTERRPGPPQKLTAFDMNRDGY